MKTDNNYKMTLYYLGKLSEYLNLGFLLPYFEELLENRELLDMLETMVKDEDFFETKTFPDVYEFRFFRIVNYVLIRAMKPAVYLETGVLHGLTSFFLLHAFERNKSGRLVSIDYPSYHETGPSNRDGFFATLPPGREPGWVVPESYKRNWNLVLGKSVEKLPSVLAEFNEIDMFLHDSEHTYSTMWAEMDMVWGHIKKGGVLICDNINCSAAFFDFCRKVDRVPFVCPLELGNIDSPIRFGIIKK